MVHGICFFKLFLMVGKELSCYSMDPKEYQFEVVLEFCAVE